MEQPGEEVVREFGYDQLARTALAFVTEGEAWPVFVSWALKARHSTALHEWFNANDIWDARKLYLLHSLNPETREFAHVLMKERYRSLK